MNWMLLWGAMLATATATAWAQGESRTSVATERPYGAYVALGNPYPSLLGINAAYNINDNLRASVGYGEIEVTTGFTFDQNGMSEQKVKAQTYAAGMDYLFLDTWVRPLVGLRAGYFDISGNVSDFSVQGVTKSGFLLYSDLGVDCLTKSGFNIGTGVNVAMVGGHGANFYANVGYFF